MTNKEKLNIVLRDMNKCIGCYDNTIDSLTENNLNKVIEILEYENDTDVEVRINRKKYIVEVVFETNEHEVDFYILPLAEYNNKYGY